MDRYKIFYYIIVLLTITVFVINLVYSTLLIKAIDVDWLYGVLQLYGSFGMIILFILNNVEAVSL